MPKPSPIKEMAIRVKKKQGRDFSVSYCYSSSATSDVGNLTGKTNMALFASFETATESARDGEHRKQEAPDLFLVLGGPIYQFLRKSHLVVREMRVVRCGLQDILRLALTTAAPLSPLLLTVFSFKELVLRAIKVVL